METKSLIKGYGFVIASAIIFGLMPLMAKNIYAEGINPPTLVFLRNLLSLPVLALLGFFTGGNFKISPKAIPSVGLIAIMGCCVTPALLFSSYNHILSGTATVFHFIYPVAVVIGEYFFLKVKLGMGRAISVAICAAGIIMLYRPGGEINLEGSFYALLSGVTYAVYIIGLSGFKYKELSGFVFSFYIVLISTVVMFFYCLFTNQLALPTSLYGWGLAAVFALCINVGAVVLFQRGTFMIGGCRASILSTFEPLTSIIVGYFAFGEENGPLAAVGSLLVIAAGVIISLSDMRKTKT